MTIALAGNPNSGKTTFFNALTGANQFVGNWAGVTVEKKEGHLKGHRNVSVTDLPGIYSLSPYTSEEIVTREYLLNSENLTILNIVDGTNLERNLYLTTQLLELQRPLVVAVNMADELSKRGIKINYAELSQRLGCSVIEISALTGMNVIRAAELAMEATDIPNPPAKFDAVTESAIAEIIRVEHVSRFAAIRLFERDELISKNNTVEHIIRSAELELDDDSRSVIANGRYMYIEELLKHCLVRTSTARGSVTAKIDKIVMNRFMALPLFAAIIMSVYFIAVGSLGAIVTDWVKDVIFGQVLSESLTALLSKANAAAWQRGLIINGIAAGVGTVLSFVPQMLILFFMLSFLEACGYMARISYMLDKLFRKFGLSGKSFIPLLVATGCGVPGIMASRTIENDNERRMTIITATFMPCSAKLPVIAMFAGAFFNNSGIVAGSAYLIGICSVLISGIILKPKTGGQVAPFVMELPEYRMPTLKNLLAGSWERGRSFIKKAGTMVLLSSCAVWFLSNFGFVDERFQMVDDMRFSLIATIGNMLSWIFIPLGFGTWQATVAAISGVLAKENIVASLSVLYNGNIAYAFNSVTGFAFLIFNLLCVPCVAAVGAIRREMNNSKWTFWAIGYQCAFAYVAALIIRVIGGLIWHI